MPGKRVVRVMPNTPCLVSEGAAAFSMGSHATEDDKAVVQSLLGAVGYACDVKEYQLDGEMGLVGGHWLVVSLVGRWIGCFNSISLVDRLIGCLSSLSNWSIARLSGCLIV